MSANCLPADSAGRQLVVERSSRHTLNNICNMKLGKRIKIPRFVGHLYRIKNIPVVHVKAIIG
jgi:hypothetical protein